MRICLYTESALPMVGGQELVVDTLARQFTDSGSEVVVVAPWPRGGLQPSDSELPYPVVRHPRFVSTRRFLDWYGRFLTKVHRRYRFDILHCHSVYPTAYVAARCSALAGVPLVVTSHCGDICPSSRLLAKPGLPERFGAALRRADAAIAISSFTEERLRGLCPSSPRIVRIPNGVDLSHYAKMADRPVSLNGNIRPGDYFLFLGRLAHRKGADILLEGLALAQCCKSRHVVVAGDGPQRALLESLAGCSSIRDRVHLVGQADAAAKAWLLQNALCTVLPSRISEGFPLVLLESCAAGTPVIGTQIPGLGEMIHPSRNGLVVKPDSPFGLARALDRASADPVIVQRLGRRARQFAQTYDWNRVADAHLELFDELVARRAASKAA